MTEKSESSKPRELAGETDGADDDALLNDDVIRIEDLAPRANVRGGRKILLGEVDTPASNPRIPPGS